MVTLHTPRLDLIPLSPAQLRLYLEQPERLELELGFPISRPILTERAQRAIRMKLGKMERADPEKWDWYTYWLVVVRALPFGAGLAGFKGIPDERGEAEIGYGIDPACQRQGYTTEAARCLIAWAFAEPACQAVIAADTKKANLASLRVLAKVGMSVYAETEDALYLKIRK